jgi:recombinational DNA repair protein (RecF pathway)
MESQACIYCGTAFAPNKYSPKQKVCSNTECQKKRQLESMRVWRKNHPNYFKYDESKVRSYRQAHSDEYRAYMRQYMRQYRQRQRGGGTAATLAGPETPSNP